MSVVAGNVSDADKASIVAAVPIFMPPGTFAADIASRLELVEVNVGASEGGVGGERTWRVVHEIDVDAGEVVIYATTSEHARLTPSFSDMCNEASGLHGGCVAFLAAVFVSNLFRDTLRS